MLYAINFLKKVNHVPCTNVCLQNCVFRGRQCLIVCNMVEQPIHTYMVQNKNWSGLSCPTTYLYFLINIVRFLSVKPFPTGVKPSKSTAQRKKKGKRSNKQEKQNNILPSVHTQTLKAIFKLFSVYYLVKIGKFVWVVIYKLSTMLVGLRTSVSGSRGIVPCGQYWV